MIRYDKPIWCLDFVWDFKQDTNCIFCGNKSIKSFWNFCPSKSGIIFTKSYYCECSGKDNAWCHGQLGLFWLRYYEFKLCKNCIHSECDTCLLHFPVEDVSIDNIRPNFCKGNFFVRKEWYSPASILKFLIKDIFKRK